MTAPHLLTTLVVAALVAWALFRRFRRLTGPQPLDARGRRRLVVQAAILVLLGVASLLVPHGQSTLWGYAADAAGLLLGAGLARWSLTHTTFERDPLGEAVRYVPNVWIGGVVFGLFVVRLLTRLLPVLSGGASATPADPGGLTSGSPLTLGLLMLFVGYQAVYAVLVLRQTRPHTTSLTQELNP